MLKGTTYMVRPFMQPRNSSSSLPAHLGRRLPVVGGAGVDLALGTDEGAVLHPGDVARVGVGPEGARALLGVEGGEGARLDELLAEEFVLGVGTVEPVDVGRLAERDEVVHPVDEPLVGGGGLHERHDTFLHGTGKDAPGSERPGRWCEKVYRRRFPAPERSGSGTWAARTWDLRPGRWGGPCRARSRDGARWPGRRR